MPGEVRDVAARREDEAQAFRRPLQLVSVTSVFFENVLLPAAPHPVSLRETTLSSFVERDSRRYGAAVSSDVWL